jgi:hypothetical protein
MSDERKNISNRAKLIFTLLGLFSIVKFEFKTT